MKKIQIKNYGEQRKIETVSKKIKNNNQKVNYLTNSKKKYIVSINFYFL